MPSPSRQLTLAEKSGRKRLHEFRKVKCDEARPCCYNCTRLNKACLYQPPQLSEYCMAMSRSGEAAASSPTRPHADEWHIGAVASNSASPSATMLMQDGPDLMAGISWPHDELEPLTAPFDFVTGEWGDFFPATLNASHGPVPSLTDTPDAAGWHDDLQPAKWPAYSYLLSDVQPPFITPWDASNWTIMKHHICHVARSTPSVATAVLAVEVLYKSLAAGDDNAAALSKYFVAKSAYLSLLKDESAEIETILIVTLLLCCFEMVAQQETIPSTLKQKDVFVTRLEQRPKERPWSPTSSRIICWLRLCHTKAMHLGGRGVLSPKVLELLPDQRPLLSLAHLDSDGTSKTDPVTSDLHDSLFQFYCEMQRVSTSVSSLNRHHRPRGGPENEHKVEQLSQEIEQRLRFLWQGRPWMIDASPEATRSFDAISPASRDNITTLAKLVKASYHAEVIYHARGSGSSPFGSATIEAARATIRDVLSELSRENMGTDLHPTLIWPLFLYTVESTEPEEVGWGLEALNQISSPLWNSSAVKELINGLSREQISTGARVDSRYFSIEKFGVPPPFM